jgi:AcrR family transcriptional regulator
MPLPKKRRYDATRRREAAAQTRRSILEVARRIFLERGYPGTTMAAIAEKAGVAPDTIYATLGNKPSLFRLLIETAISGSAEPIAALDRAYVRQIRAESDPLRKLTLYARAVRSIQERLAPLFRVLQSAASLDADLASLWREISQRRAANMRVFARELKRTGGLRPDLGVQEVADVIWSMNSPEFYLLLVEERGWSPSRFERWLATAWAHLLLEHP